MAVRQKEHRPRKPRRLKPAAGTSRRTGHADTLHKLTPPRLTEVYSRTRLFKLLDRARRRPGIWIAAPAGAGKTTLVASYLNARKLPCLWYQVDAGDADLASFFYYLALAARKAAPRTRKPFPLLTPEYLAGLPVFARNFFRDLYGRLKRPSVIVLDNYQELPENSVLHELLRHAIEELPDRLNLFIISRVGPLGQFAHSRVTESMSLVEPQALRLTLEEAIGVSRLRGGKVREVAESLHRLTDGWMAGIVLMLERSSAGAAPGFDNIGEHEVLFDYFASEVFARTAAPVQDFLLKTAILPKLTVPLAEGLTGATGSRAILHDLVRRNYFTVRHPGQEAAFQYHPLFRDFLAHRAATRFTADALVEFRRTAARLLAGTGDIENAIVLLQQAQDWGSLVPVLLQHAPMLVQQGRMQTLSDWLQAIPPTVRDANPWLRYWLGIARMPFALAEARAQLEAAFESFKGAGDRRGQLFAWSSVVETFIYEWGDFHPLDRWIAELDTLLAESPESLTPELEGRVALWMFLALTYRQPGSPQLRRWTPAVEHLVECSPDTSLRFVVGLHLLLYYAFWGAEFAKGANLIDMLTPIARTTNLSPLPRVAWHATQAAYHLMVGDNEACLREAKRGLEVSAETGVHLWDFMLRAQGVWGWLTAEDLDRAATERGTLHAQLDPLRYMDATHYHYQVAMAAWYQGEIPRMKKHAEAALLAVRKAGVPWAECLILSGLATAHVESGDLVAAEEVCGESRRLCETMHTVIAEFCLLFAEYEIERGRPGSQHSTVALRRLLEYGRRIDLVGGAMWNAQPLARICLQGLRHHIEPDYVRRIIKRRGLTPPADEPVPDTWPYPLKLHTLGRFTVTRDDKPLSRAPSHQKPLALLQALIALGGREVDEAQLAECFWPEAEGDVAIQNLKINVHRLRQLLPENALTWTEGKLTLDARQVWVDLWALERELNNLDQPSPAEATGQAALAQRIFSLYRGEFLSGNTAPWALAARERLRHKTLRVITRVAEAVEDRDPAAAVPIYEKAIEIDPLRESLYQGLMRCHQTLHQPAEVEHVYRRCRDTLKRELGLAPSPTTEALHQALKQGE